MFGLLRPRCPVDLREKTWIELRLRWLIQNLPIHDLNAIEVVTPTPRNFPEKYTASDQDIERMFDRVCAWMHVPRGSVALELYHGQRPPEALYDSRGAALGLYQQRAHRDAVHLIWIDEAQRQNPMQLVATMAHELSHCLLLGDGLLTDREADHEFVTDLLPVLRGMGIFLANSVVAEENYSTGNYSYWRMSKQGYLPARMFGYALAVFAWLRDEHSPHWGRSLRGDARTALVQGLRFLRRTGDSRCPRNIGARRASGGSDDRLSLLKSSTPGERIEALWQLRIRPEGGWKFDQDEWDAILAAVEHRDPVVRCEAAHALTVINRADSAAAGKLIEALRDAQEDEHLRAALALALGTQPEPRVNVLDELRVLLDERSESVSAAALVAIQTFGKTSDPRVIRVVLERLKQGLVTCKPSLSILAAAALRKLSAAPGTVLSEFFANDAELRRAAFAALAAKSPPDTLTSAELPTPHSLPVPIPGWHPPVSTDDD